MVPGWFDLWLRSRLGLELGLVKCSKGLGNENGWD